MLNLLHIIETQFRELSIYLIMYLQVINLCDDDYIIIIIIYYDYKMFYCEQDVNFATLKSVNNVLLYLLYPSSFLLDNLDTGLKVY